MRTEDRFSYRKKMRITVLDSQFFPYLAWQVLGNYVVEVLE
jgi:hypothetical protein